MNYIKNFFIKSNMKKPVQYDKPTGDFDNDMQRFINLVTIFVNFIALTYFI